MKEKLMNYPTETDHEAMGQRQRTEDHGKVIFAHFGLKSGMVYEGTTVVYRCVPRFNSK